MKNFSRASLNTYHVNSNFVSHIRRGRLERNLILRKWVRHCGGSIGVHAASVVNARQEWNRWHWEVPLGICGGRHADWGHGPWTEGLRWQWGGSMQRCRWRILSEISTKNGNGLVNLRILEGYTKVFMAWSSFFVIFVSFIQCTFLKQRNTK